MLRASRSIFCLSDADYKEPGEDRGDDRAPVKRGESGNNTYDRKYADDDTENSALELLHSDKTEDTCKEHKNSNTCGDHCSDVEREDGIECLDGRIDSPEYVEDADDYFKYVLCRLFHFSFCRAASPFIFLYLYYTLFRLPCQWKKRKM